MALGRFSPTVKRLEHDAHHSLPTPAEDEWSYTSTPPYAFMEWAGATLRFTFTAQYNTLSPLLKVQLILCVEVILVSCSITQNVLSLYVVHLAALYVVHTVQGSSNVISLFVIQEVSRQISQSVRTSLSPHSTVTSPVKHRPLNHTPTVTYSHTVST
jgi:hypothetical protein